MLNVEFLERDPSSHLTSHDSRVTTHNSELLTQFIIHNSELIIYFPVLLTNAILLLSGDYDGVLMVPCPPYR